MFEAGGFAGGTSAAVVSPASERLQFIEARTRHVAVEGTPEALDEGLQDGRVFRVFRRTPGLGRVVSHRWGQRRRLRWFLEVEAARQCRVFPRHLFARRCLHHIVAYVDENVGERPRRGSNVLDEGRSERRVATLPVQRHVPRLSGEADQRAHARFYGRQPRPDSGGARAHRAGEIARQGVIATGVEKQDVGLGLSLHETLDKIEPHHLELEGRGGREFGVHGRQEIAAVDLQAVAGEVEHACIGA